MSEVAEAVARTREMYAELTALWEDEHVAVAVHGVQHQEIHAVGEPSHAFESQGLWHVSVTLGDFVRGPKLFAELNHDCAACQALWRVEMADREARQASGVTA
jgi:hypothetical protein